MNKNDGKWNDRYEVIHLGVYEYEKGDRGCMVVIIMAWSCCYVLGSAGSAEDDKRAVIVIVNSISL